MTDARAVLSLIGSDEKTNCLHKWDQFFVLAKLKLNGLSYNLDPAFDTRKKEDMDYLCALVRGLARNPICPKHPWNVCEYNPNNGIFYCPNSLCSYETKINSNLVVHLGAGCWQWCEYQEFRDGKPLMSCRWDSEMDCPRHPDCKKTIPALAPLVQVCKELGVEVQHVS